MTEMVLDPNFDWNYPDPANTGRAYKIKDAPGRYIVYLKNSFPAHLSLEGLRVVLDCANGRRWPLRSWAPKSSKSARNPTD